MRPRPGSSEAIVSHGLVPAPVGLPDVHRLRRGERGRAGRDIDHPQPAPLRRAVRRRLDLGEPRRILALHPRRPRSRGAGPIRADPGGHREDPRSVGRPGMQLDRAGDLGEGIGLPGIRGIEQIQLRAPTLLSIGPERQPRAVRRPSRLEIITGPVGQLADGSAGCVGHTDPMSGRSLESLEHLAGERDGRAVGGWGRVRRLRDAPERGLAHPTHVPLDVLDTKPFPADRRPCRPG